MRLVSVHVADGCNNIPIILLRVGFALRRLDPEDIVCAGIYDNDLWVKIVAVVNDRGLVGLGGDERHHIVGGRPVEGRAADSLQLHRGVEHPCNRGRVSVIGTDCAVVLFAVERIAFHVRITKKCDAPGRPGRSIEQQAVGDLDSE